MAGDSVTAVSSTSTMDPTTPLQPTNGTGTSNGATTTTTLPTNSTETTIIQSLSADEIALYDRQIRLWGAQAQERIRSAHILLVSLRALGTEIAKNLVLAGIGSLTIIDDEVVTEEDLGAQYFLRQEDVGKARAPSAIPRIRDLNPRVSIKPDGGLQDLLLKNENYYHPFTAVIACDHDFLTLSMINTAARFANVPFYAAGLHGFYGYIFADLVLHDFVVEREKSNRTTSVGAETATRSVVGVTTKKESQGGREEKTVEIVRKRELYCPFILANTSPLPADVLGNRRKLKAVPALLPCLRALFDFQRSYGHFPVSSNPQHLRDFTTLATNKTRELQLPQETLRAEFLRSFIQNIGAEVLPTAAFVGGRLSEDVINVISKKDQPIQNFALFDGDGLEGRIYSLYSPPPEASLMDMGVGGGVDMGYGMDGSMNGGMGGDMGMMGMPVGGGMDGSMDGSMDMAGMQGMQGVGMMMDGSGGMVDGSGGMMDASMMNMGSGGLQNGAQMGDLSGGVAGAEMGAENGSDAVAETSVAPAPDQAAAQEPPRSVPTDEAGAEGS